MIVVWQRVDLRFGLESPKRLREANSVLVFFEFTKFKGLWWGGTPEMFAI